MKYVPTLILLILITLSTSIAQPIQQEKTSQFTNFSSQNGTSVDINAIIQYVIREAYLNNQADLEFYAKKVQQFTKQKKEQRDTLNELRKQVQVLKKQGKKRQETEAILKQQILPTKIVRPIVDLNITRTRVSCNAFQPRTIPFPTQTYQRVPDCSAINDLTPFERYIEDLQQTAEECMQLAEENRNRYQERLRHLITEVTQIPEIERQNDGLLMPLVGLGDATSTDLAMDERNYQSDDYHWHIKDALDSLTYQVQTICKLANNINTNILRECGRINTYITTGTEMHPPGLTQLEREMFTHNLQNQQQYATRFDKYIQEDYNRIRNKRTLEDLLSTQWIENKCKQSRVQERTAQLLQHAIPERIAASKKNNQKQHKTEVAASILRQITPTSIAQNTQSIVILRNQSSRFEANRKQKAFKSYL